MRNLIFLIFHSVLILLLFASCSDDMFKQLPQAPVVEEAKVSILSRKMINIDYIPTGMPNRYDAKVSWPSFKGSIKVLDSEQRTLSEYPVTDNRYTLRNLEGGQELTINFETYSSERQTKSVIKLFLLPPKDIVFDKSFSLSENQEFTAGRVFILDQVKIYTNEFCLRLNFNELIIGTGVEAYHFSQNQKASAEVNGKHGGCLTLIGKKASGFIKFRINSEAGGDGIRGFPRCGGTHAAEVFYDCYGTNGGSSGQRGQFLIELENSDEFEYDFDFLEVLGGSQGTKNLELTPQQRTKICLDWIKQNPQGPYWVERYKSCDRVSVAGKSASGGKICFKLNKEASYECIEKN